MNQNTYLTTILIIWSGIPSFGYCQTEGCFPGLSQASYQTDAGHTTTRTYSKSSRRVHPAYPMASTSNGRGRMEAAVACGETADDATEKTAGRSSFELRHRDALRRLEMRRQQAADQTESTPLPLAQTKYAAEVRCGELDEASREPATQTFSPRLPTSLLRGGQAYSRRKTTPRPIVPTGVTTGCLPDLTSSAGNKSNVAPTRVHETTPRDSATEPGLDRFRSGPIVSVAREARLPSESSASFNRFKPARATDRAVKATESRFAVARPNPVRPRMPTLAPVSIPSPLPAESSPPKVQLVRATEDILIPEPYDANAIKDQLNELPIGAKFPAGVDSSSPLSATPSPCENVGDGPMDSPCDSDVSSFPNLHDFENASVRNPFAEPDTTVASPRINVASQSLSQMRLSKVFSRLDTLPDKFVPSPNTSQRNPYTGSAEQFGFRWTPRNLTHRTLYFEDMPLERYGLTQGWCKQMLASAKEFFWDAAIMPLRWGKEVPCDLHYTLGHERAGSCPPRIKERTCPVP